VFRLVKVHVHDNAWNALLYVVLCYVAPRLWGSRCPTRNAAVHIFFLLFFFWWATWWWLTSLAETRSWFICKINLCLGWICLRFLLYYRGADKFLARPSRKQTVASVRMAWISFGALPCRKTNFVTALVSMLLKSRASLTCFRAHFL